MDSHFFFFFAKIEMVNFGVGYLHAIFSK